MADNTPNTTGDISAGPLRFLIKRVKRLEKKRQTLESDIRDIFTEATSTGFDVNVLKQILNVRAHAPARRKKKKTFLDTYRKALGI